MCLGLLGLSAVPNFALHFDSSVKLSSGGSDFFYSSQTIKVLPCFLHQSSILQDDILQPKYRCAKPTSGQMATAHRLIWRGAEHISHTCMQSPTHAKQDNYSRTDALQAESR